MIFPLIVLALILLWPFSVLAAEADHARARPLHIFMIAGQSNASGRGLLDELPAFAYQSRVFAFTNQGKWAPAVEPMDDASLEQYEVLADAKAGASPMLAFGDRLAELRPDWNIGIIPCPKGSTGIADWQRNLSTSTPYGACLARIQASLASAPEGSTIDGSIFYQGETESMKADLPQTWPSAFTRYVADLRSDLGLPDLLVVVTVLGPNNSSRFPYWAQMQEEQQEMTVPVAVLRISASDLTAQTDSPHLTTVSYVRLGKRWADALDAALRADIRGSVTTGTTR